MTTSIQEMQWVLRAQCSDRDALESLLRSVQPSLRRCLTGLVGATDADDLLQDVLIILLFAFYQGAAALHGRNQNAFIHAVMIVLGVWMTLNSLLVVIQMTVMTKRILRAIDLASRK